MHNKIDRLPAEERISRARAGLVAVSAETGEGIPALQAKIARALGDKSRSRTQGRTGAEYWEEVAARQASGLDEPSVPDATDTPPGEPAPRTGPSRIGGSGPRAASPRSRKRPR